MMKASGVLAIVAFAAAVDARNLQQPEATASYVMPWDGISPMPTAPPAIHDLRRRQQSSTEDLTVLFAPDNTCGFISGRPGAAYTCGAGANCVFFTSSSSQLGHVACCNTVECNVRAACIDYEGYFSSSQCDDGCAVDAFTAKCTDTAAPYCNTISFDGGIIDYWCNTLAISTPQKATTSYDGQEADREFTPVALTDESTTLPLTETGTEVAGPTISSDPSDDDNSDGNDSDSDGSGGGGGGGGGGSKTPIGPIVGGVVGGVAAIAIVAFGIFFFLRKKKKNQAAAAANTAPPPMQQQQQQGPPLAGFNGAPPGQHQSYYDPKYAASTQPYSPGSEYAQPNGQQPAGFYAASTQHTGSPDPHNPSSPTASHDPRMSQVSASPSYTGAYPPPPQGQQGFQPQGGVIHEAPATSADNHRGAMHELA